MLPLEELPTLPGPDLLPGLLELEEPGLPGGGVGCTLLLLLGGVDGEEDTSGVSSGESLVGVDGVDLRLICASFPVGEWDILRLFYNN